MANEKLIAELKNYEKLLAVFIADTMIAFKEDRHFNNHEISTALGAAGWIEEIQDILGVPVKTTIKSIVENAGKDINRHIKETDKIINRNEALTEMFRFQMSFTINTLFDTRNYIKEAVEEIERVLKNKEELDQATIAKIKPYLDRMVSVVK